ncbi:3-oxoacyl-[acyl-carrier-protein] synthase 2 [Mycolicibacterium madagascariense]|uniref:3-oxoacyl-[acyl-carrier-protein] synthase 2 n=1 Tax=Mycolicibacterium madagascariense TaxID=212765 RepID=A0A7I7XH40_9MYCO|nr:beta-ketoacyl synthase N-terminal-like domain-containing protein [Mycolicibacterium madagascariense]MCV7014379.1 3-oxoacyl-ACP synthase [Mycolicibacterium madagascariense]BBZ28528.1 3-oxoacyl-[acyl-carrier-protein] synthase 2 [Mycolicibacterium madagascariense]
MSHNHVGVEGLGLVTGYGWGREVFWEGMCSGKSAARLVGGFGPDGTDSVWLARIPEGGVPTDGDGLFGRAFLSAGREAVTDALSRGWVPGERVGVIYAGCFNDMYIWREISRGDATRSRDFVRAFPSTPTAMFTKEFDFHGPSLQISATCSSANNAMLTAKQWLDVGWADDVVVVACDLSFTPEVVAGFAGMRAAVVDVEPQDACRPFQEGGRGFPPGEAAVAFVVSSRSHDPYARLLGGAMTSDGHHATGMEPSHSQVIRCVRDALVDAGVSPGDVGYLNAHGTGTEQCNDAEVAFLDAVFADQQPWVYALKPLIGHCLASAGAVELAAGVLAYERGVIPASPIVSAAHPRLLDGMTAFTGGVTLKTSMGMGGYNSALLVAAPAAA